MINEKVGIITTEEKEEIEVLYERKLALEELAMTLDNPEFDKNSRSKIYERIIEDLGKSKVEFECWWEEKSKKYQWKSIEGYQWKINFETREIFLVEDDVKCNC
ncbi:CXXX repeat peptide modification system protein [Clostridium felsineum]|uniref:CXXX repeat peptide modification system protein n=1 Tax=Clostridium felsineum TaxID=36839 RepID=UPI00214D34F9|nr:CXXX repeat peptide modification system protein [Clostridium felsineum]MCR3759780.1 CXXX repeat peptide modification system protein [Clostridium felsineum]